MTFKKRIKIKSSRCTFVLKLYLEICCDIEESLLGVDVAPVLTSNSYRFMTIYIKHRTKNS
jgi:hypothetical protein